MSLKELHQPETCDSSLWFYSSTFTAYEIIQIETFLKIDSGMFREASL
jgi:hypothetical protein